MSSIGDIINGCLFILYFYLNYLDILKLQFGQWTVYVVEKQLTKELFVMKMINIGPENSEERKNAQKEIGAEISIGMILGQDCPFLVQYLEIFYHKNFCCLIMEHCELGDVQKELNSGKQYEESVSFFFFILIYFFRS
jgi:NIMA (never in mitosis gene a)-related kinase